MIYLKDLYSASTKEREMVLCFLSFHEIGTFQSDEITSKKFPSTRARNNTKLEEKNKKSH